MKPPFAPTWGRWAGRSSASCSPITLGRRPAEFVPELAEPLERSPAEIGDAFDAAAEALMDAELVGMPHARAAVERVAAGDRRVGLPAPAPEHSSIEY
jgi:hypothetical protein